MLKNWIAVLLLIGASALSTVAQDQCTNVHWNWKESEELTWKQSVERKKGISEAERNRLIQFLTELISRAPDFPDTTEGMRKAALQSRVKYIDLNRDGVPEVVVQATSDLLCGATGNCSFWILQEHSGKYVALLSADAQTFTVQPGSTDGFRDIVLTRHNSAFQSDGQQYRFNGTDYVLAQTFTIEWSEQVDGQESKPLPAPKLTNCVVQR